MYKNMKNYVKKSDLKDIFLKLATNGQSDKASLLTSGFCPQRVVCPCPGVIYLWLTLKMCIKSEFKEISLKLAKNVRSDKGFLLTSKVCSQGVFCPCPGAIYMYKITKNVYKIRFQRDHFETCNIWAKRKSLSVVIKILSPVDCLPLPRAIYIWWNMKKMYIISDFKAIFVKPATNGQSDKGFLLTSKVCPQGVFCPCPRAIYIYIYIIIKNVYKIRFLFLNLQRIGKMIRAFCLHQQLSPRGYMPLTRGYIHV